MSTAFDSKYLNNMFINSLRSRDMTKLGQAGELYIRTRLREDAICRKILPPVPVTKEDCQRSTEHDTLTIVKDIAPDAEAVSLTFRGKPDHRYIQGKRYEIGLYKIASPMYTKTEAELLAYEMPITSLIEEDIVKMMQYEEDVNFFNQCKDIVANNGKSQNVSTESGKINKAALTVLFNMLDGDSLEPSCVVMSATTFNEWAEQGSEVFDQGSWDVAVKGYTEPTILGRKIYVTRKEDIVPKNTIWTFAAPEFLGHFFTLDDAKFWVDSRADEFFMQGWEMLGVGIGNTKGIAKINITKAP